jgi:hypothetical protein
MSSLDQALNHVYDYLYYNAVSRARSKIQATVRIRPAEADFRGRFDRTLDQPAMLADLRVALYDVTMPSTIMQGDLAAKGVDPGRISHSRCFSVYPWRPLPFHRLQCLVVAVHDRRPA